MDLDEIEDDGVHGGRMRPLASLNANTFLGKRHLYAAAAMAPSSKVKRIVKSGYGSHDNAHLSAEKICQANSLFQNAAARSTTLLFPKKAGLKRTNSKTGRMLQGPNICKQNIVAETKARKHQRTSKVLAEDVTVQNMKTLNGSQGNLELLLMALDSCSDFTGSNVTLCRKDKRKLEQRDQAFERVSKRTKSSSCLSEVSPKRKSDLSIGGKIDKETRREALDQELAPSDARIYPSSLYRPLALKELCLFDCGLSQSSTFKENQTNCKQPSTSSHNSMTKDQNLDSMEVSPMADQSKICLTLSIGGNLIHREAPKPTQKTLVSNLISETDLILAVCPRKVEDQHSLTNTANLPNVSLGEQKDVGSVEEIREDFSQAPSDVYSSIGKCLSLFPVETEILISDQNTDFSISILQQGLKRKVSNPNLGPSFKPGILKKSRDRKQVQACLEAILATVGKADPDASIEMRKKDVREPIATPSSFELCKFYSDDASACINSEDEMQNGKNKILECHIDREETHPQSLKLRHGHCGFIQSISCRQTMAIVSNDIEVSMEVQETTRKDTTQLKICKQKKINAAHQSCRIPYFPDAAARCQAYGDHVNSDTAANNNKLCKTMELASDKANKWIACHEVPNDRQLHKDGVSKTSAQQNSTQAKQFSGNAIAGRGYLNKLLTCVESGTDNAINEDHACFPSLIDLLPRCTHSMSTKDPAGFAARWLELLRLDIKGRLSALKRSKQRVRATVVSRQAGSENVRLPIQEGTQDTAAKHTHSCCKQRTGPYPSNFGTRCSKRLMQEQELQTIQHWSSLFTGMDIALSLEKEKLESWLKSIQHVKANCRTSKCQEKQRSC